MSIIYPTNLPGLAFSAHKKPIWNTEVQTANSGREVRIGYSAYPNWEWDLDYEYLPDAQMNGATASDLQTMMGLFLATRGNLIPFLFQDPDDYTTSSFQGNANGTAGQVFQLRRSYGLGNTGFEPVGVVNLALPFTVYSGATLVAPTAYTVSQTTPYNQTLTLTTAQASGNAIVVNMSYYYYARFKDPTLDFEKFMASLWMCQKINLLSCKG